MRLPWKKWPPLKEGGGYIFRGGLYFLGCPMLEYTSTAKEGARWLSRGERQVPYATSLALNRTASAIQKALVEQMGQVFDRPTPYTLRSLRLQRATKQNLTASVAYKDFAGKGTAASKYLRPQVDGGKRRQKRFENALGRIGPSGYYVPAGGADQDAYGNMSRGQIVKLLSYLQAFGEQGYRANATDKSRARTAKVRRSEAGYRRINGVVYFISRGKGTVSGNRTQHLPAGVWRKTGTHGADVAPVLLHVDNVNYTKRLPFYETADEVYGKRFEDEFTQAFEQAMATAR